MAGNRDQELGQAILVIIFLLLCALIISLLIQFLTILFYILVVVLGVGAIIGILFFIDNYIKSRNYNYYYSYTYSRGVITDKKPKEYIYTLIQLWAEKNLGHRLYLDKTNPLTNRLANIMSTCIDSSISFDVPTKSIEPIYLFDKDTSSDNLLLMPIERVNRDKPYACFKREVNIDKLDKLLTSYFSTNEMGEKFKIKDDLRENIFESTMDMRDGYFYNAKNTFLNSSVYKVTSPAYDVEKFISTCIERELIYFRQNSYFNEYRDHIKVLKEELAKELLNVVPYRTYTKYNDFVPEIFDFEYLILNSWKIGGKTIRRIKGDYVIYDFSNDLRKVMDRFFF